MDKKLKILQSFTISAFITVIFIAVITVSSELLPLIKTFLKNTFVHHWIGKSVIAAGLFLAVGLILWAWPSKPNVKKIVFWLYALSICVILAFLAIFGFFVYEWMIK